MIINEKKERIISVTLKNNTAEAKEVSLFSKIIPEGIEISGNFPNGSYEEFLALFHSLPMPLKAFQTRIQFTDRVSVENPVNFYYIDLDGSQERHPMLPFVHLSKSQFQSSMIDIGRVYPFTPALRVGLNVPAQETIGFVFFVDTDMVKVLESHNKLISSSHQNIRLATPYYLAFKYINTTDSPIKVDYMGKWEDLPEGVEVYGLDNSESGISLKWTKLDKDWYASLSNLYNSRRPASYRAFGRVNSPADIRIRLLLPEEKDANKLQEIIKKEQEVVKYEKVIDFNWNDLCSQMQDKFIDFDLPEEFFLNYPYADCTVEAEIKPNETLILYGAAR